MKDVYSKEPWLLDHPMGTFFMENEWYYFVTRTQVAKKNIGCGKKAKRKITREEDCGVWKANAKEDIMDKETKKVIGEKQTLAFVKSSVSNKKQKRGDGSSCDVVVPGSESRWIMTEYKLPEIQGKFQELVICKIHVIKNSSKKKKDDDCHEASTSSYHHHYQQQLQHPIIEPHHHEASTYLHQQTFLAPFLEDQPSNIIRKIQENNKDDHEALIPYHHEFVADSSTKQKPINEAHGHVPEIPLIGSQQEAEKEEEEEGDRMQEIINSLTTVNVSSLPMEEDDDILFYDMPFIDQDLLDQYATLRPQESSKTLGN
ncbi:hypothetical protein N665_0198s0170 [Sinapis alba]|nr:hypothetical protein N665_0198s0170 [Sinapis alba]